jgi:hypothetical protein
MVERLLADMERIPRKLHAAQPFAFIERTIGNEPDGRRYCDAAKLIARFEHARSQMFQILRQTYSFKAAPEERFLPDVFDAVRYLLISRTAGAERLLPYAYGSPSEPQG